jgi:hypothetical protein
MTAAASVGNSHFTVLDTFPTKVEAVATVRELRMEGLAARPVACRRGFMVLVPEVRS